VPETGSRDPWVFRYGRSAVRVYIVPVGVQTGCVKGCRVRAQWGKGRREKEVCWALVEGVVPWPAEAEYAESEDHSEWVICGYVSIRSGRG
jgi:hypothetical protein